MKLSKSHANDLCALIIMNLHSWPSLKAALQEGGFEHKSSGRIESVIEAWKNKANLLVLSNVKLPFIRARMDLVLIDANSVGNSLLDIDTIFEIKTNYSSQTAEIRKRLALSGKGSAIEQVRAYQGNPDLLGKKDSYILYIITALPSTTIPRNVPRSPGWVYGTTALEKGIATLKTAVSNSGLTLLGDSTEQFVYCALIQA